MTEIIKNNYTYENLEVGQIYKNYKHLCEALNAKVESSNSKNAQFKEWNCYFSYSKQGNKFIIDEIYETPKEKEDLRALGKNSVYADFVQLLILDYLSNCDGSIVVGRNRLMQTIGMVNRNYSECRASLKKLAKYTNVDIKVVYDFYNTTNTSFRQTVEYNLTKLSDRRIIMFDTVTKVKNSGEQFTKVASTYQKQVILNLEKNILEEMGIDSMSKVRVSPRWHEFKRKLDAKLKEVLDIDFYFKAYDITINSEYLESEKKKVVEFILEKTERILKKEELNSLVISKVNENAQNRSDNAFHASKDKSRIRSKDTYTSDIDHLAKLLLSINSANIVSEVMKVELDEIEMLTDEQIKEIEDLF